MRAEIRVEVSKKDYPKLMVYDKDNDFVVLFQRSGVGTVIRDDEQTYGTGHYYDRWVMDVFKDFEGELLMSND
jgi:hypothetical protein